MAPASAFTPKASLTDAPTNLKEAIDWVLRVTGRDGKELNKDECICGLAAAVTDLLQSVELEYHGKYPVVDTSWVPIGYQGESDGADNSKGPPKKRVTECLNELFSLVQGLGGTAVVRTYIDQLAQVLSALVGWSRIEKCWDCKGSNNNNQHGIKTDCGYLKDATPNTPCKECECMKWEVKNPESEGTPLGRKCTRCSDSDSGGVQHRCQCSGDCKGGLSTECKCAKAGKCCKCCCKDKCGKCSDKCSCMETHKNTLGIFEHKDSYRSSYQVELVYHGIVGNEYLVWPTWSDRKTSKKRAIGAQILLGSVCLIWSGLTYMYWTGKYHSSSPRWNNHILDGRGLDDGTLSQWLQALGFPREMLNNSGPGNRLDAIIWDGFRGMLYLGFPDTGNGSPVHGGDYNDNTFRQPAGMNYAGYIHTVDRGAFCSNATIFHKNGNDASITDEQMHKCGALYKLYILSCAYFTGLQKKNPPKAKNKTPKTIREILYWLSALPYSLAYPEILKHAKGRLKEVLKKPGDTASSATSGNEQKELKFYQEKRSAPITVHEYNLFAHFQAVTQYCPPVLIGIQGGIHCTKGTEEPAIHSLYANTECHFTYPTVSIQAYNQVVHYIRALFYQLYFLRKQCAVKVALGGKWRECRYGNGVVSKGVISWMCLGCDPMEHDRKKRVGEMGNKLNKLPLGSNGSDAKKIKDVLEAIGQVVVQLGNAQEALEGKEKEAIEGVKVALGTAKTELDKAVKNGLNGKELEEAKKKLEELTTKGGGNNGILGEVVDKLGEATNGNNDFDQGKNKISAAIDKVREILGEIQKELGVSDSTHLKGTLSEWVANTLHKTIDQIKDICNSPKCPSCKSHSNKCGRQPQSKYCDKCHQQYMDGFPSPLQAFLEDRLPGFSCQEILYTEDADKYPPAASHLGHCNGSGQCCPLPMGFRGQFHKGSTSDMTGQRLYGILYFFSNENMMQSCVYTLVRVTAALSATTPQVLGDVFGFFRGGVGNKDKGKPPKGELETNCDHTGDPSGSYEANKEKYFCGWCASGLRDEVQKIEWIYNGDSSVKGGQYMKTVGKALRDIKGEKDASTAPQPASQSTTNALSALTKDSEYLSPLTGELYTAVSATFGGTYLSWVLYLSDALHSGLESLSEAFRNIECRGCKGQCDPNKCKKGVHGQGSGQCGCQSIVSCTGVLPVLYRHGFSYGNPFNLEGYYQNDGSREGDYSIENTKTTKRCHDFLSSLNQVINKKEDQATSKDQEQHPLSNLLSQVGKLQYDIRLPWIFVLTIAWLVAVLYLAFGAIWPLDWTHMRSHWLRGGEHQWQCMWYKVMTGRKGMELVEYLRKRV
ncbi:variant erythrocyte surface antigen-1 alpha subunit [Babesia bovis T2Bo]|uniref:Variant erythrocyte surface antigen-1, alpha subunit n=1 Tax=Babesia bovis TaxID=5865 RepID=A7AUL7_BABBO|nr:variant erythrocyte surface antigen-1 alpha subunit [Babesia bovis T2Bo]EDO06628.1 variant erythrocyte surface antigen-1 alpha subunit [Babesia bovis T2Bo]|eukprot:XP_001610196.1 variant erythrocyte surface antigen-1, alpha subunit [Babesia bovis T2Bo]